MVISYYVSMSLAKFRKITKGNVKPKRKPDAKEKDDSPKENNQGNG
jgi:hypothetical protein